MPDSGTLGSDSIMPAFALAALDFSPVFPGMAPRDSLRQTIELAPLLESFGYSRLWLGEHHSPGIAHASPEVLLPVIAGLTDRIRVGTGGILLGRYSAQKVAETFRLLHALYPGRIDLGIARGSAANRQPVMAYDFEKAVTDLLGYLRDEKEEPASPIGVLSPEIWLLGSKTQSMEIAARLGTAFCFAQFLSGQVFDTEVIASYRDQYHRTAPYENAKCSLAVAGVCAPTDKAARALIPTNAPYNVFPTLVGSPETCLRELVALHTRAGVTEFMFLDMCQTFAARVESYGLLADAVLHKH
jgi:luciferase family oxidoreductase group 1